MANDSDDARPTVEDADWPLPEHHRRNAAGQGMKKAIERRVAKGREASKEVHFKEGESLWDCVGREIDAAERGHGKG